MTPQDKIRHYMLEDTDGVTRHLQDFVSVPAFIYQLHQDNYLSISKSILNSFALAVQGTSFQSFLERMNPADRFKVFSLYAQDVPSLMRHREGELLPKLRGFDFSIRDKMNRWRHGVVKLDVSGYDAQGKPDRLFGVFLLDDTPLSKVEEVYGTCVEDIYGEALANRIHEIRMDIGRLTRKRERKDVFITQQEKKVLYSLGKGLSTHEIAEHLNLSFHTIEDYRKKLLKKFEAKNTTQMILKAVHLIADLK